MICEEFYFNPQSHKFLFSSISQPCKNKDGYVRISPKTASRIARKDDIVAKMDNFLNNGKIESLISQERPELGGWCDECRKDGKYYAFYTGDENFVPMQVFPSLINNPHFIDKSQFKAMMLYLILKRYFNVPLLDKQPEDCIEFSFYDDGTATDGTGITYCGEGLKPESVRLVPDVCHDESRRKIYTEDEKVSVIEFVKEAAERNASLEKILYGPRDESEDMVEDGLIDIYGEPGGWQFNNED